MSSRKIIVKKLPETLIPLDPGIFRVVKITGPRINDVDLIGSNMDGPALKKFLGSIDRQTVVEIVE